MIHFPSQQRNRMRTKKNSTFYSFIVSLLVFIFTSSIHSYAQCEAPSISTSEYCNGQQATIEIDDNGATNIKYGWYISTIDNVADYGEAGDGRVYKSPNIQNGPNTFYYGKEIVDRVGPTYASPEGGADIDYNGTDQYIMSFDNTVNFSLHTVTAVVRMESDALTYGFAVRYNDGADEYYSAWISGPRSSFLSLGSGLYRIEIPVDIEMYAGTGRTIEIITDTEEDNYSPAEGFYWWDPAVYNGDSYLNGLITIDDADKSVGGSSYTPLISNWDVTVLCDRQSVSTSLAPVCCIDVADGYTLTSSESGGNYILTTSGTDIDASMYYYWFNAENNLIADGQGLSSYTVPDQGQYSLRVVRDAGNEDKFACYSRKSIVVGIQSIKAPDDFTVCLGEPISVRGEGAEGEYNWYSEDAEADSYIVTKNVQKTDIQVLEPGIYTYFVEGEVKLGNVAEDGKFEQYVDAGSKVFETAYGEIDNISGPGEYMVTDNIVAYGATNNWCMDDSYWNKIDPVTNDEVSRGQIYVADAVSGVTGTALTAQFAADYPLWQLSGVTVEENTCYTFSADVSNWNDAENPPNIMVLVNNTPLNLTPTQGLGTIETGTDGTPYYHFPENVLCEWETIEAEWCSGAGETSATIVVSEVTNQLMGYEFAMDDVTFFTGRGMQTDEVEITVDDCNEMQARADISGVCLADPADLYMVTNNGFFMDWENYNGEVVATTETATVFPLQNETYTARVKFPLISYITNGDFEQGDYLDFNTSLEPQTGTMYQGYYGVGNTSSSFYNTTFMAEYSNDQKPGTAGGNAMIVWPKEGDNIFEKTIPVSAGEEYGFSVWLDHLYDESSNDCIDYELYIKINGTTSKTISVRCGDDWSYYDYSWTAPTSGNTTITLEYGPSIYNVGLAVDNIRLAQLGQEAIDEVMVTVQNCFDLEARANGTICAGDSFDLYTITNDGYVVEWKDSEGFPISGDETVTVYPAKTETYTVSAKFPMLNIIKNAGFEDGANLDFTTNMTETQYGLNRGQYYIGVDEQNSSNMQTGQADHTTGSGEMFVGRFEPGNIIFNKTITATAGEQYGLSIWFKHLDVDIYNGTFANSQPYILELFVDGTSIKTMTLEEVPDWTEFTADWKSAITGNSTIELTITYPGSTYSDRTGFAMDDVHLSKLDYRDTDQVTATVDVCNGLTLTDDCNTGQEREVYYEITGSGSGVFMGWYDDAGDLISTEETLLLEGLTTNTTVSAKLGVATGSINKNGDFDNGASGHDIQGTLQTGNYQLYPSNYYSFTSNPSTIQSNGFVNMTDATGNNGPFLAYNTNTGTDKPIYTSISMPVEDMHAYQISFSATYISPQSILDGVLAASGNTGQLYPIKLYINNTLVGSYDLAQNNDWQNFTYNWIQEGTENIVLELRVDKFNEYSSTQHLAWGIDDVYLNSLTEILEETITVEPCTPPCNKPTSVSITQPADICAGENVVLEAEYEDAGEAVLNTSMAYVWYEQGTGLGAYTTISGTGTVSVPDETLSGLTDDATYILRVEDGDVGNTNCYTEQTVSISVDPAITVDLGADQTICEYETATIDAGTSSGSVNYESYSWSSGETTASISPTTSDTYSVTVTAGVCSASDDMILTIKPEPTSSWITTDFEYCGSAGLSLEVAAVTNADYQWKKDGVNWGSNSATQTGATSGEYSVSLNLNGCTSDVGAITVTGFDNPEYTISGGGNYCENETVSDISIEFTSGSPNYSFSYTVDGTNQVDISNHSTNTYTISNPEEGIYRLVGTITDAHCSISARTDNTEIVINSKPNVNLQNGSSCANVDNNDLSSMMSPSPSGGEFISTTGSATLTTAGIFTHNGVYDTYTIEYEYADGNDCSNTASASFIVNENISPTITGNPADFTFCEGNAVTLGTTQTFDTYNWTETGGYISSNSIASPTFNATAPAGTYTVTVDVTDNNGCSGSNDTTITVHALPTATIDAAGPFCEYETVQTITAVPSTTVQTATWSSNITELSETTAELDPATASASNIITYSFIDNNGCEMENPASISVAVHPRPNVSLQNGSSCANVDNNDLSSMMSPSPSGGEFISTTGSATLTTAGIFTHNGVYDTYTIEYEYADGNDCSNTASASFIVNENISPTITGNPADFTFCEGNAVTLGTTQTFDTYNWTETGGYISSNSIASPTFNATAPAGTYTVTVDVTDNNGCSGSNDTTITVHALPTATIDAAGPFCEYETVQTITAVPSTTVQTATWSSNITELSETTAELDPATASASNIITYSFIDNNGCEMENPASISVVVHPRPTISIAYPNYNSTTGICSYANPLAVDLSHDLTNGSISVSPVSSALNTSDGSFDPSAPDIVHGNPYTITYTYTNPSTTCSGNPVSFEMVVHDRPITDISMNTSDMCDYESATSLTAELSDGTNISSNGTFSGAVTGTSFDPVSAGGEGSYTLLFNYTAPGTQCAANEVSHTITVHHIDAPTPTHASAMNTAVHQDADVPPISVTGTNIKWYETAATTTISADEVDDGDPASYNFAFVDDGTGDMLAGTYSRFATQTDAFGCESNPSEVTLTITSCPAPAPKVANYHACEGDAPVNLGVESGNGNIGVTFGWWLNQSATTPAPIAGTEDATGITWNGHSFTTDGTYTVYVAEYDNVESCYGPATAVTINVHGIPNPTITDPGMICYSTSTIDISYTPQSNSTTNAILNVDNGTLTGSQWIPYFTTGTGVTNSEFTLSVDRLWGTSGIDTTANCSNSSNLTVSVTNIEALTGTGIGTAIIHGGADIINLPDMELLLEGDSLEILDSTSTIISTNPTTQMYPSIIDDIGTYSYTTRQYLNGCVSPHAPSEWHIVNCPTLAPQPKDTVLCYDENMPLIRSNAIGASPSYTNFEWRDSTNTIISTNENLDLSLINGYSSSGTHTFTVSYEDDDLASGTCRGPEATVTMRINPEPTFTISLSTQTACYDGNNVEISLSPTGSNTLSSVDYTLSGASDENTAIQTSGLSGFINPDDTRVGVNVSATALSSYTIQADVTDSKGCTSSNTEALNIQYIAPPTGTGIGTGNNVLWGISDIANLPNLAINTSDTPDEISILDSVDAEIGTLATQPLTLYNTHISGIGYYEFEVRQSINSCVSNPAVSQWNIVDCPTPAPVPRDTAICEGNQLPLIPSNITSPTATNIIWIDPNGNELSYDTELNFTNTLASSTYDFTEAGEHTISVSFEDEDLSGALCRGPQTSITLTVNPEPTFTISLSTQTACYDGNNVEISLSPTGSNTLSSVDYTLSGASDENTAIQTSGLSGFINPDDTRVGADASATALSSYTIQANVTDSKGCTSSNTEAVNIQYVAAPETEDYFAVTTNPTQVSLTPIGNSIQYYTSSNPENTTAIANGSPWNIPTTNNGNFYINPENIHYSYLYATQTEQGCESETSPILIEIINCPVPRPGANSFTICDYNSTPTLEAIAGTNWPASAPEIGPTDFRWFTQKTSNPDDATQVSISQTFTPGNVFVDEINTWYVAQYDEGYDCMGESKTVNITVNSSPEVTLRNNPYICEGDPLPSISVQQAIDTVYWYDTEPTQRPPETPEIATGVSYTIADTYKTPDTYTFYAMHKSQNCWSNPSQTLFAIHEKPQNPEIENLSQCENDIIAMEATADKPDDQIYWYSQHMALLQENTPEYIPENSRLQIDNTTTFNIQAINSFACKSDIIPVLYELKSIPEPPEILKSEYCISDTIQEEITAIGTHINWYSSDNLRIPACENQSHCTHLGISTEGEYTVGVSQTINGCESEIGQYDLIVAPFPQPEIKGKKQVCENSYGELYYIEDNGSDNTYEWQVSNNRVSYAVGIKKTIRIDWDVPGYDTLIVHKTNPYGCLGIDTTYIEVAETPIADFEWSLPGAGQIAEFTNTSHQENIQRIDKEIELTSYWLFGRDWIDTVPYIQTPETFEEKIRTEYVYGNYTVNLTVENEYGCSNSISKDIFVDIKTGLFVPNAFAPNSPSLGVREFIPSGFNLQEYEIIIYDVWGNTVWYSNKLTKSGSPAEGWDGTYNGKSLKSDTYIWKINATFVNGVVWKGLADNKGKHSIFGTVLLIK
jgi:hypothetical protein